MTSLGSEQYGLAQRTGIRAGALRHALIPLSDGLDRLVLVASAAMFVALVVSVFSSVISRYFGILTGTFDWIDESSRILFVWVALLGASRASRFDRHIRIDIPLPVPPRVLRLMDVIASFAVLVFLVPVFAEGVRLAVLGLAQHTPSLGLPMTIVFAVVPVTAAVMFVHTLRRLLERPIPGSKREPGGSEES